MKTALVAIGRRENQYAREWVEHYLNIGFNHIFICDNNRYLEERFEDVIGDYVEDGKVKFVIEESVPSIYSFKSNYLEMSNDEILKQISTPKSE